MKNCDEIVHDLLERREEYMKTKKERMKKLLIVCSTAICSLTVICMIGFSLFGKENFIEKITATNIASNSNKLDDDMDNIDNQKVNDKIEKKEYAVYTDRIMLPEDSEENIQYDMIGCLYYKGSVYTQAGNYSGEKLEKIKELLDERIGEAKGNINEWSTQDEWATEFASTYSGSVYKMKGYGEDFRLCVYNTTEEMEQLVVLDNYDGIGLNTGSDLFEERLHLTGNVKKVMYQTHSDWNRDWDGDEEGEKNSIKKLGITEKEWDKFIKELCRSPFEAIDYQENGDFYNNQLQGHLFLEMEDGMEVGIRLIDGGYVGCSYLGWYFVNMPGKIFDKVMKACQK